LGSFDTTGVKELCEAILGQSRQNSESMHSLPWLHSLSLDGNNIQSEGMSILSEALHLRNKDLQRFSSFASDACTISQDCMSLNLANRNLGPEEANFLGACLQCIKVDHLQEMDLSHNNLCGYDNSSRESFNLSSFMNLCSTFKRIELASLTSLNLAGNCFGARGICALVEVFHSAGMIQLEVLNLDQVGMIPIVQKFGAVKKSSDFTGIIALSESLEREDLPVLHTLSIAGNNVTNTEVLQAMITTTRRRKIKFNY